MAVAVVVEPYFTKMANKNKNYLECYHVSRVDKRPKSDKIKSEERCLKMKKYSKEFKTEALKLSDEIGVKKAAAQLGLQYYTIADWRKNRKAAEVALKPSLTDDEMRIRNSELERENAELRRANDILKDALGFFAKDRKK